MDYPRGVDGLAFAVKQIENDSADEKREDDEGCKSEGIPSDHHRNMIQRKADRAEDTRPVWAELFGKSDETESSEDEFF